MAIDKELLDRLPAGRERDGGDPADRHNGRSQKTVLSGTSRMRLSIPRDRAGTFSPKLIAKHQRGFPIVPGILPGDAKEVLGIWSEQTEGVKFPLPHAPMMIDAVEV